MYKLPEGEYPICSPVKMVNVSVNAVSSSLNVGQQTTTLFTQEGYSRSIIHMHKWQISPPEYLMLDLNCGDETPSPTQEKAYLIIYGVKGKIFRRLFFINLSFLKVEKWSWKLIWI